MTEQVIGIRVPCGIAALPVVSRAELTRTPAPLPVSRFGVAAPPVTELVRSPSQDVAARRPRWGTAPRCCRRCARRCSCRVRRRPTGHGRRDCISAARAGKGLVPVVSDGMDGCDANPCPKAMAAGFPGIVVNTMDVFGPGNRDGTAVPSGGTVFKIENAADVSAPVGRATNGAQVPPHCRVLQQ